MVLRFLESIYWNVIILRRIGKKLARDKWKQICEQCYERHLPNTVTPNYVVQEVLDYSPNTGNCDLCEELTFLVYVSSTDEDLLPFKKECDKCQEETNHLLFYKKTECWQECQYCGHHSKYTEVKNMLDFNIPKLMQKKLSEEHMEFFIDSIRRIVEAIRIFPSTNVLVGEPAHYLIKSLQNQASDFIDDSGFGRIQTEELTLIYFRLGDFDSKQKSNFAIISMFTNSLENYTTIGKAYRKTANALKLLREDILTEIFTLDLDDYGTQCADDVINGYSRYDLNFDLSTRLLLKLFRVSEITDKKKDELIERQKDRFSEDYKKLETLKAEELQEAKNFLEDEKKDQVKA